jgi:hypothetical protein
VRHAAGDENVCANVIILKSSVKKNLRIFESKHIRITEVLQKENQRIFVAEYNQKLVGCLSAIGR